MSPSDIVALALSIAIIGGAIAYILCQKRKGNHCIGCPDSSSCPHRKSGYCHK